MSNIAIKIKNIGKRYQIGEREPYHTLRETVANMAAMPRRCMKTFFLKSISESPASSSKDDKQYIWALRNISLEIERGEVLGIIGANGAGKSTLLKILSRITEPTEGRGIIRGRTSSLLEVGTGFHHELTGRDNIYLNGAILGMKRFEINQKFDAIVGFSGINRFIDTPVKRYSSGMFVRLAFAVAAHLDPEILFVDEVLAVGDAAFQKKCLGKMSEQARSGRTVFFVSHNLGAVRNLCSKVLFIEKGGVCFCGNVDEGIQTYLSRVDREEHSGRLSLAQRTDRWGTGRIRVVGLKAEEAGERGSALQAGAPAKFIVAYKASSQGLINGLGVILSVRDEYGVTLFSCSTFTTQEKRFRNAPLSGELTCFVERLPLIPGTYSVALTLKDDHGVADRIEQAATLEVLDAGKSGCFSFLSKQAGSIVVPNRWELAARE